MNSLATVPDVQLVLTQLQILADINHFDANFLSIFTTISEKNHMQNVKKKKLNYELVVNVTIKQTFSQFFSSVGTNSSTLKAGNEFCWTEMKHHCDVGGHLKLLIDSTVK